MDPNQTAQKRDSSGIIIGILLVVIIIAAVASGVMYYIYLQRNNDLIPVDSNTRVYQTHESDELDIQFDYPEDWTVISTAPTSYKFNPESANITGMLDDCNLYIHNSSNDSVIAIDFIESPPLIVSPEEALIQKSCWENGEYFLPEGVENTLGEETVLNWTPAVGDTTQWNGIRAMFNEFRKGEGVYRVGLFFKDSSNTESIKQDYKDLLSSMSDLKKPIPSNWAEYSNSHGISFQHPNFEVSNLTEDNIDISSAKSIFLKNSQNNNEFIYFFIMNKNELFQEQEINSVENIAGQVMSLLIDTPEKLKTIIIYPQPTNLAGHPASEFKIVTNTIYGPQNLFEISETEIRLIALENEESYFIFYSSNSDNIDSIIDSIKFN